MKQISIFVQNKRGRLADISKILTENDINVRGTCLADSTEYGILRMVVDKPELAAKVILDAGYTVNMSEILSVEIPDMPGKLSEVLEILDNQEIGIDYLYSYVNRKTQNALIYFKTHNLEKALEVLNKAEYTLS